MRVLAAATGCILLIFILADAISTVVLARRSERLSGITRLFYRYTWRAFASFSRRIRSGKRREDYLGIYGPLSFLNLLACWAAGLIFAFGLLYWSGGLYYSGTRASFPDALFFSGTSLVTVGSFSPENAWAKVLMIFEGGIGLSLLGLVIGYLPVLYQSYSTREFQISLLDARAGSPPSAGELLSRQGTNPDKLESHLADWEVWAAELLQNHLSYPMLAYFRSQHVNHFWLSALVAIVDTSAVVELCSSDDLKRQAELTFAMGRHVLVDLARMFRRRPTPPVSDRLPAEAFARFRDSLASTQAPLEWKCLEESSLRKLRSQYEPYAAALSIYFLAALPPWSPGESTAENWRVASSAPPPPP